MFALVIGLTWFGVESAYGYLLWSGMGALLGNLVVLGLGLFGLGFVPLVRRRQALLDRCALRPAPTSRPTSSIPSAPTGKNFR